MENIKQWYTTHESKIMSVFRTIGACTHILLAMVCIGIGAVLHVLAGILSFALEWHDKITSYLMKSARRQFSEKGDES